MGYIDENGYTRDGSAVGSEEIANAGCSTTVDHADDTGITTLLAAAAYARVVTGVAVCTEALAGDTTPPTVKVGVSGSLEAMWTTASLAPTTGGGDLDDVTDPTPRCYVLAADTALVATVVDATGGNEAGKIRFDLLAVPVSE